MGLGVNQEPSIVQELKRLEERLLDPAVRKSSEAVGALLADRLTEFGSSGRVYDKAQALAGLMAELPVRVSQADFSVSR